MNTMNMGVRKAMNLLAMVQLGAAGKRRHVGSKGASNADGFACDLGNIPINGGADMTGQPTVVQCNSSSTP
jgi:hypothetical protein